MTKSEVYKMLNSKGIIPETWTQNKINSIILKDKSNELLDIGLKDPGENKFLFSLENDLIFIKKYKKSIIISDQFKNGKINHTSLTLPKRSSILSSKYPGIQTNRENKFRNPKEGDIIYSVDKKTNKVNQINSISSIVTDEISTIIYFDDCFKIVSEGQEDYCWADPEFFHRAIIIKENNPRNLKYYSEMNPNHYWDSVISFSSIKKIN